MSSLVRRLTFDCSDAYRLAQFWAAVLDGSLAGDGVHVDPQPQDRSRDEEVERVLALGATVVGGHRSPDGTG
ncbi:VOC family protein [Streptomyces sp. RGM 3693]|uniref:VOC family protein n=1 Tax=Streptomyces sp. RGM 3693 TaxID=3413284 RepID=UPI003D270479